MSRAFYGQSKSEKYYTIQSYATRYKLCEKSKKVKTFFVIRFRNV